MDAIGDPQTLSQVLDGSAFGSWRSDELLERIRETGGPLVELPIGTSKRSVYSFARSMYRSIFHWQPLITGYSSYWPTGFWERMELARQLPAPEALATLHEQTGLALVLAVLEGSRIER